MKHKFLPWEIITALKFNLPRASFVMPSHIFKEVLCRSEAGFTADVHLTFFL